jgi:hypothetical protein
MMAVRSRDCMFLAEAGCCRYCAIFSLRDCALLRFCGGVQAQFGFGCEL